MELQVSIDTLVQSSLVRGSALIGAIETDLRSDFSWVCSRIQWFRSSRRRTGANNEQRTGRAEELRDASAPGDQHRAFLTVRDIEKSARYYERVFGARILSLGDGNAPAYLQLANIWMILNVGGGPTPDKPTITLSVPDPSHINSFMNFRVADIQACYELWKSRGAEFITEPIPKYGEIRCYIRDLDGYIIEVGQSTDLKYG
jgi:catechol 2,3-dioxygenase-like lactoylglutathione lyase family enzyme